MAIAPRFHRVAALQRQFVDREPAIADFLDELGGVGAGPRVFNITGVGGIGKSRLLRELSPRVPGHFRTASLDLQVPVMRQQEEALAVLRIQLGKQGVRFDRFDIAYAVLWQRLHPHLRLTRSDLPFITESGLLTEIVDSVAGVPVFGTAVGLIKILEQTSSGARRRRRIRLDATLRELDALPNTELVDAVTYLFAEDLRAASEDRPYLVVIDAYEALVPAPVRSGRLQLADVWLRDLVGQLDKGLVAIASREPLGWEAYDTEWRSVIRICPVDGLPMAARRQLLTDCGVNAPDEQEAIANASAGLPFYLHLAVDTRNMDSPATSRTIVSRDAILNRFLQHVETQEIRILEMLGVARIFDFDIFQALAAAYHLPADRVVWDSLTAYSFVYPAGAAFRLHQLMATALRERLAPAVAGEVHALLRRRWDARVHATPVPGAGTDAVGLREAAYHGVRSRLISGADLLSYADLAVRLGTGSASGILQDLREFLADEQPADNNDLMETARCLAAEEAIRFGDAGRALELTPQEDWRFDTAVGGRLAVAAGNARRIAGQTAAALTIYTAMCESGSGSSRLDAGLWAADLHMCQGRFREAEDVAEQLDALAAPAAKEFRGDVARLRHLAHRLAFDHSASARYLELAADYYHQAGATIGLANIQTNRAELLALTDPAAAVVEAGRAIEVQQDIGAQHELGKAYTALALAQTQLGQLTEAEVSMQAAVAALDRAGYRSGRARAELFTAAIHVRRGEMTAAVDAAKWAITELEASEVYPTLVLAAAQALEIIGRLDAEVTEARDRARRGIQPMNDLGDLESRLGAFMTQLLQGSS